MKKYVIYYRVSTQKQGRSGLGLESQRQMCNDFIRGVNGSIVAEFTDIESGKNSNRESLNQAIDVAKKGKYTLLVAKLDRLSREVEFIFHLRNSGVDFVCSDMPDFNTLTLGIFATIAQHEREMISERTKKALQIKKAQGFKLGNPNIKSLISLRKENAYNAINNLAAGKAVVELRKSGLRWCDVVNELSARGLKARRGGAISKTQAQILYKRYNLSTL